MARMETVTRFFDELHSLSVLQAQLIEEGVEMKVHVCKTLQQKASQRAEREISLMSGLRFKDLFYPLFGCCASRSLYDAIIYVTGKDVLSSSLSAC